MGPYKHNVPVWYLSHNTPEWHKNLRNQDNHGTKYMGSPVGETDGQSRSVTEWYWEDDLPHWTFIYSPTRWIQFLIYRIHEVDSSIEVCIRPLKPSISWGLKKFKWINCHRLWFDFLEIRARSIDIFWLNSWYSFFLCLLELLYHLRGNFCFLFW